MATIISDAKSNFWSLQCKCGSIIKITGENLLREDLQSISCPNCRGDYTLGNLKTAVQYLDQFQIALGKATDQKSAYLMFKNIIPPGFEG